MATMYYRPYTSEPIKDGEMPPHEAVGSVLPEYQYIFVDPDSGKQSPPGQKSYRQVAPASTRAPPPAALYQEPTTSRAPDDLDKSQMNALDHQNKELENYRSAVHKMGGDILTLRQNIRDLENNNSQLRLNLANYNDSTKIMAESNDLEGLTKPEIMSRYVGLKQTLQAQTGDIKSYKEKVQVLQNELIKKNDQEKGYIAMSQDHLSAKEMLKAQQERLKRLKKLEEACKKQEKVIEKMEGILEKQHRDRSKMKGDKAAQEANEALLQENKRLRTEIEDLRMSLRNAGRNQGDDMEKLELMQALEKAQGRIHSLEKQLQDNSRNWGKERADLAIKLNEAEHGFGRSQGMVLHDFPVHQEEYNKSRPAPRRNSPLYR